MRTKFLYTGYNIHHDYFKDNIKTKNNDRYFGIFDTKRKNCAFIGFCPSYNWPKISEKQSILFSNWKINCFQMINILKI